MDKNKLTEYSGGNPPGQGNTCADRAVKVVCLLVFIFVGIYVGVHKQKKTKALRGRNFCGDTLGEFESHTPHYMGM